MNVLVDVWLARGRKQGIREAYEEARKIAKRADIVQLLDLKFPQVFGAQGATDEAEAIQSKPSSPYPNPINEVIKRLEYVETESRLTELVDIAWNVPNLATFMSCLPLEIPPEPALASLRELYKTHDQLRHFSIEDYYRLIETDFFQSNERVELIDGLLFTRSLMTPRHRACMHRLVKFLERGYMDDAQVLIQSPIILTNSNSALMPDISVVHYRDDEYASHYPEGSDVYLAIELSQSAPKSDPDPRCQLYAREKIAEYWRLDITDNLLDTYCGPKVDEMGMTGYRLKSTSGGHNELITPLMFPGCFVFVDEIFR